MNQAFRRIPQRLGQSLTEKSVSQKTLGRVCMVLTACMLLPLILIALYNYPADDDFGFVLPVATAWAQTGSLWEVLRANLQKTYDTYMAWQGNFVSTAFFSYTPMVFHLDYYFFSNWLLLGLFCLSAGYLLKSVLRLLGAPDKSVFWIVYTASLILGLQFMPCIGEGIFWHNGGMYTAAACTLMLTLGLLLRTSQPQSRRRALLRGASLALCGFMLGGSFYGPALGALVILALLTVSAFVRRGPNRYFHLVALGFFLISFVISVLAPGVALRQERLGEAAHPLVSVVTAALDSFDLAGGWLTPQLFAMLMLILPVLWQPLKDSKLSFQHPLAFFLALYGMFSAALVPGIYTGSGYSMGRYLNVIYFYFLIMLLGSAVYLEGWLIRYWERKKEGFSLPPGLGKRFTALYLAFCVVLLAMGGFAFTIMNTSSVSAAKSLVTGEAARFREDMRERQEYILVTDSDEVNVQPLASQPYVFKADRLPFQGIYGRVRYMKWYFELFDEGK